MTTEPVPAVDAEVEAVEILAHFSEHQLDRNPKMQAAIFCILAALTASQAEAAALRVELAGAINDRRLSYNLQEHAVRQRDAAIVEREEAWATVLEAQGHADTWRDRALAAETEAAALKQRVVALEGALEALVIESGGKAIPNTNLTICRDQAIAVLAARDLLGKS